MTCESEKLVLDRHNYPTWAMDVKISLALRGIYETLCHTPILRNRTEASIRVPRMFKSHAWQ
jgi:hypothetical protein